MPDFAPNMTPRYKVHYRAVNRTHTAQMRSNRGASALAMTATGQAFFHDLFNAMASILVSDFSFLSAEVALTDSDLFFPAALPVAVVGANPVAGYTKQDSITHTRFSGRGSGGSKVNVSVYGINWVPDLLPAGVENDFIVLASESPIIANSIAAIQAIAAARAIDNTPISWRAAATIKVNDAWIAKVRQGL